MHTNPHTNHKDAPIKYHVTLASGRDFILNSGYDVYEAAYEAYEQAAGTYDDYLVNVEPIYDV